ncbi:hypothetical protein BDV96DRAFT_482491 [Lophiotrema nucula]|uniref:Translation initiation factor IF-2, mitochondrial n=1 Tax=Lophiotrema nucula TaxID=690887 RepID=A0A6A5ZRN4_9PLEO|nr:hypothetical protein BDV96DRAFT_482491 [Lophiotrema nucula]
MLATREISVPQRPPPPPPPPPRSSPSLPSQYPQRSWGEPRNPVRKAPGRDRPAPLPHRPQYQTRFDARPPSEEGPRFGIGNLRKKNEAQTGAPTKGRPSELIPPSAPRVEPVRKLDQAELDRLLGNDPNTPRLGSNRPYRGLRSNTGAPLKCFHCGRQDHQSVDCPSKPVLLRRYPPTSQETLGSTAQAAEEWIRRHGSRMEPNAEQVLYEEDVRPRKDDIADKRRSRLQVDEADDLPLKEQQRNRYEAPDFRRRPTGERRPRGRVQRDDEEEDNFIDREQRKKQRAEAKKKREQMEKRELEPTPVYLPEYISVTNLASLLKVRVEDFVRKLEQLGFEEVQNDHILNAEHAGLVAQEYNFEPIVQADGTDGDLYPAPALSPEDYAELPQRPPVVTIMGHVDHGKTTILDYMRSTSVAAGEFGGITQHIGAFSVPLASGKKITFLDTPGHAAFETMRARGANVTDIVVLVVAADDSVMPQTVEAIKHAQSAQVPIIVAINKIDKPQADPERVKQDLARQGIEVEDFGGEVQTVNVSGKTGQGIPDLEEAITTLSEILDHRADPLSRVEGWVLEGTTKKSGKVATVLVRTGTLRQGDILVAGNTWTRVRSLHNEAGLVVKEVGPGMPVEVDGWREQPIAGDEALQAEDEQQAAQVTELRTEKIEREQMAKDMEAINEHRRLESERRAAEEAAAEAAKDGIAPVEKEAKQESGPELVSFIVKADVSGSAEAVVDSIASIGNAEVGTRILRHGVGAPSEFDVQHAADAQGHIVNFNTAVPSHVSALAEQKGVKILDSNIIYRVVENVKALLSEKLAPKITQRVIGEAEVAAIFDINLGGKKNMRVAGTKVRNGVIDKKEKVRVLRGTKTRYDGTLSSLKNHKKDVDQMRKDTECGLAFSTWEDFKVGDKVQCYTEHAEPRHL